MKTTFSKALSVLIFQVFFLINNCIYSSAPTPVNMLPVVQNISLKKHIENCKNLIKNIYTKKDYE